MKAEVVLEAGETLLSILMDTPAEKNFSPAPVMTMAVTLSSKRARMMASSKSRNMP